jgi:hypothetical protein
LPSDPDGTVEGETTGQEYFVPGGSIVDDHECGIGRDRSQIFGKHTQVMGGCCAVKVQVEIDALNGQALFLKNGDFIVKDGDRIAVYTSIIVKCNAQ